MEKVLGGEGWVMLTLSWYTRSPTELCDIIMRTYPKMLLLGSTPGYLDLVV